MGGGRTKWVVIAAWLIAAAIAFPFQSKLQALASDESDAFKDNGAESTKVDDVIEQRFAGGGETTAVILYTQDQPLTEPDFEQISKDGLELCEQGGSRTSCA